MKSKPVSQGNIVLTKRFPKAKIGDRVACWVVQCDEYYKPQVLLRQGFVLGLFGKGGVQVQDEELQGIEEPFYVGRDMLFEASVKE